MIVQLDNWICVVPPPPTHLLGGGLVFAGAVPEREVKMEAKLYVGNMAKTTTEDELRTLFAQAGTVSLVEVIKDRDSGQSKGFAFITMGEAAEAEKAISMFNAYSLAERELKVNIAKPRVERPS
jgi:RNA recognition motif-containing protein